MSDFTWTSVPAANDAVSDNDVIIDEKVRKMRLTLLDRDLDTERPCTLEEARTWPWSDPPTWWIVAGWQITSFDALVYMLSMRAEKGVEEVTILQSPRSMILAGG